MAASKRGGEPSKERRCPHCGKPDWCILFPDGGVNCYRNSNGISKVDDDGCPYYYFPPTAETKELATKVDFSEESGVALATVDQRDRLYRALLDQFALSKEHRKKLLGRGLTEAVIQERAFRTMTESWTIKNRVASYLAELFPFWMGVPGMFLRNEKAALSSTPGILIPIRDLAGRILGLKVRLDNEEGGKYRWVSSRKKGGPSSGGPAGYYPPIGRPAVPGSVRVCEGAFKAIVSAELTGIPAIAAGNGVGSMASSDVFEMVESLNPQMVYLCPDQNAYLESSVTVKTRTAWERWMKWGQEKGIRLQVDTWQSDLPAEQRFDGIDDALVAGVKTEVASPEGYLSALPGGNQPKPPQGTSEAVASLRELEAIGEPGEDLWPAASPYQKPATQPLAPSGWSVPEPFSIRQEVAETLSAPLWVFPDPIRRTVETISRAKQITNSTVAASLIGLLSAICAGRYCARLAPQYQAHSFVWVLLSLASSGGKSESFNELSKAIFAAEKRERTETQDRNDRNAGERANLRKQIAIMEGGAPEDYPGQLSESRARLKEVESRLPSRFIRRDISPQKIGVLYAQHQRVSIVSAESADWISLIMGYGKETGALLSSCLSGFSVEPYGEDRITREESHCNRPVLSLLIACQEAEVKSLLGDPVARRRGFLGRTLVFQADSLVGERLSYDKRPENIDLSAWETLVRTVTQQVPQSDEDGWLPISLQVDPKARALYSRVFDIIEKRLTDNSPDLRLGEIEDISGRSMEQVGRLAVLIHILWTASRGVKPTEEPIGEESVLRGFAIVLWALQGFLDLSGPAASGGKHNAALDLWKDIRGSSLFASGACTVKDWVRLGPNRWRNSAKLDPQLATLRELGYLDIVSRKNLRGPVSKVIELNPMAVGSDPKTVATVATVFENPLFIELISEQPHLRQFATDSAISATVSLPSESRLRGKGQACDGIAPLSKGSPENVATVAAEVRAAGDLF